MGELRLSFATFAHGTGLKVTFLALAYLDLALTLYALSVGHVELNPLVAGLQDRPLGLLLVKVGMPVLIAWLVPARLLLPSIALLFAVTGWNVASLTLPG